VSLATESVPGLPGVAEMCETSATPGVLSGPPPDCFSRQHPTSTQRENGFRLLDADTRLISADGVYWPYTQPRCNARMPNNSLAQPAAIAAASLFAVASAARPAFGHVTCRCRTQLQAIVRVMKAHQLRESMG
jgi:hypothetical protein